MHKPASILLQLVFMPMQGQHLIQLQGPCSKSDSLKHFNAAEVYATERSTLESALHLKMMHLFVLKLRTQLYPKLKHRHWALTFYRFGTLAISKSPHRYHSAMMHFQLKALYYGITYYVFQQWHTLGSWSQL